MATENEKLAASISGNRTTQNEKVLMMWIKANAFYNEGSTSGGTDRIYNGEYKIPDICNNGFHTFVEGVDFVRVRCNTTETVTKTYTLVA